MATKTKQKSGVGSAVTTAQLARRVLQMPLSKIRADAAVQSRANFDEAVATDYSEAVARGDKFPPIIVFHDPNEGVYWLADGFTRRRGHELAGRKYIDCEVRDGTKRDAILYSVGANANHGLRRTNEDKRFAVLKLLNDAGWRKWSNSEIAKACGVDEGTVRIRRKELENAEAAENEAAKLSSEIPKMRTVARNGTTYEMDVSGQKESGGTSKSDSSDAKAAVLVCPFCGRSSTHAA